MKTYHARLAQARSRSTSFRLDRGPGKAGTVCGAEMTDHDVTFAERNFRSVRQAPPGWTPCSTCLPPLVKK